ncbi:hypothetical protein B0H16DRAFT_1457590 [Mycena metata]|uniref:Uncharacterized protein n=1 Tax=Mycena metata TaxID=1033252 RepID=A0AAD7NDZ3_9AGAR|nr:hypothetical protein B0H16DRAFT_1457590 [Mycena metata]
MPLLDMQSASSSAGHPTPAPRPPCPPPPAPHAVFVPRPPPRPPLRSRPYPRRRPPPTPSSSSLSSRPLAILIVPAAPGASRTRTCAGKGGEGKGGGEERGEPRPASPRPPSSSLALRVIWLSSLWVSSPSSYLYHPRRTAPKELGLPLEVPRLIWASSPLESRRYNDWRFSATDLHLHWHLHLRTAREASPVPLLARSRALLPAPRVLFVFSAANRRQADSGVDGREGKRRRGGREGDGEERDAKEEGRDGGRCFFFMDGGEGTVVGSGVDGDGAGAMSMAMSWGDGDGVLGGAVGGDGQARTRYECAARSGLMAHPRARKGISTVSPEVRFAFLGAEAGRWSTSRNSMAGAGSGEPECEGGGCYLRDTRLGDPTMAKLDRQRPDRTARIGVSETDRKEGRGDHGPSFDTPTPKPVERCMYMLREGWPPYQWMDKTRRWVLYGIGLRKRPMVNTRLACHALASGRRAGAHSAEKEGGVRSVARRAAVFREICVKEHARWRAVPGGEELGEMV